MYLLIAMMMLFLCTCSKDEGFLSDSSRQDDLLKKAKTKAAVFPVSPNGVDDTQAIIDAFDEAKAAGPGSVVQLAEGEFRIGFIEIRDFYGYFRGAGRDMTKVRNLDVMPTTGDYFANNNTFPVLLCFVGGDVHVSKMTFATTDGPVVPDDLYYGFLESFLNFADYTGQYTPPYRFIKGVVEEVDFIGGSFGGDNMIGTDHNIGMAVYVGSNVWVYGPNDPPYGSVDVTIKNCGFDHVGLGPDAFSLDERSTFVIENIISKNTIYDLFVGASHGCKVYIRNNQFFESPVGTVLDDADLGLFPYIVLKKPTEYYVWGNYFERQSGSTILSLIDNRRATYPDEGSPQLFDIKGNTFITQEGGTAIYGLNNKDAKIWNNKFTGTGSIGVMIDGTEATDTWAENNNLIGNNFFDATYTDASVYLGPYSMNCKVVGVAKDLVVDEGVNNSVIGTKAQKKGVQASQNLQNNLRNVHKNLMRRGRF